MAAFAGALGTKFEKLEHYSLGRGEYEITLWSFFYHQN